MIRIVVRHDNANMAVHVGGAVHTSFKTFDYDLPFLEMWLADEGSLSHTQVIGVEIIKGEKK